jgi:hypothetical protein
MSSTLHLLLSNIFDIYPDQHFMQQFVQNDDILIDKLLSHPSLKFQVFFCQLWNAIYKGTYPTRKDFQDVLKLNPSLAISQEILHMFPILNLGLSKMVIPTDIQKVFDHYKSPTRDQIKQTIYQKLVFRYVVSQKQFDSIKSPNFIISVVNIISHPNSSIAVDNVNKNPISGSFVENVSFTSEDHTYMTSREKAQYVIFKDLHFMMKLIDRVVIYVDDSIKDTSFLKPLIQTAYKVHDDHVILMSYPAIPYDHDPSYQFTVHPTLYNLLPCMSKQHITCSHYPIPLVKPLSSQKLNATFYSLYPFVQKEEYSLDYQESYGKTITNRVGVLSKSHYVIHEPSSSSLTTSIPIVREASLYHQHMVTAIVVADDQQTENVRHMLAGNAEVNDVIAKGRQNMELIMSDDYICMQWTFHLKHQCPLQSRDLKHSILLYLDLLTHIYLSRIEDIMTLPNVHSSQQDHNNCMLLIDNRPNMLSVLSALISFANLNENWTCIIVTSSKAASFYEKYLGHIAKVIVDRRLDVVKFHIDIYNRVMMEPHLWETTLANYEKCLVVQDDGILLRKGIERFIEYDYVGAPWIDVEGNAYIKHNVNPDLVGNGGLSLRTVDVMKRAIQVAEIEESSRLFFHNINHVPEDVFFVKQLKKLGAHMPSAQEASFFSSEEILNANAIGLHKVWSYHDPQKIKTWFDYLLKQQTSL